MMNYRSNLLTLFILCIVLSSCSSSDSQNEISQEADDLLISGGSCAEIDIFTDENEPTQPSSDEADFFTCGSVPNTNIDTASFPSTGTGAIAVSDFDVSVDSAAVEFFPDTDFENHSGIQLYLHDGELRLIEQMFSADNLDGTEISRHKVSWGIYSGTIVLSVELASAATEGFANGTFEFMGAENPNDQSLIGVNAMFGGTVFQDLNDNGTIDSLDEILLISGGNITIVGDKPNWSINVDVMLSNGEEVTGTFDGDYVDIPLAEVNR